MICLDKSNYIDFKVYGVTSIKKKYGFRILLTYSDGSTKTIQKAGYKTKREANAERESAITRADGDKEAAILNAEAEKESNIRRAEGVRQAKILEADGEAQAIRQIAEAKAQEVTLVYGAIRKAQPDERLVAIKSLEALEKVADGSANKVFIPFDATKTLASVSAIVEAKN